MRNCDRFRSRAGSKNRSHKNKIYKNRKLIIAFLQKSVKSIRLITLSRVARIKWLRGEICFMVNGDDNNIKEKMDQTDLSDEGALKPSEEVDTPQEESLESDPTSTDTHADALQESGDSMESVDRKSVV